MNHKQFCPIALGMDVIGDKWTLLIVRELLSGSTRFNELQRGLGNISPTLLTKRLNAMNATGLLLKKRIPGQRGYEYFPTKACEELFPVIEQIGIWGMHWARSQLSEEDFDLELLMLYLEKSIQPEQLVGKQTVIKFNFKDVDKFNEWWIVVNGNNVDVCVHDPRREIDIYFNVGVRTMCELWMGDITYKKAMQAGKLEMLGSKLLIQNVEEWLKPSIFAGVQPASEII